MKQLKTIVAFVAGLFAFTSVNAGELSVTGSMQATYQSEQTTTTGNPLGINTDITLSGSTDTDFGTVSYSMATDGTFLGDSGADHKYSLATDLGTFTIGNAGDSANAVDDITPTAFEEANGAGSGSYTVDFGSGMEGSMSIRYSNGDVAGTGISVSYDYYPKLDGATNNEKGSSADTNAASSSAQSVNVGIPVAGLPLIGDSPLGAMKITLGYEESDSRVADSQPKEGGTVAVVVPVGNVSIGFQKKAYQAAGTSSAEAQDVFYKDDILGIAYAVNDDFAISYNIIESEKHLHTTGEVEQETKGISVAYTVGGLTLALQDAKTSNSGWSSGTDNDTRTFSIKTAF
tara:strand:+ start:446 stop:1480 length:1035 start_codon:yes stop_codon:yes gene_type:complete